MTSYDVKRLALILSMQAEFEAMKVANRERDMPRESAAYDASEFMDKARELDGLARKPDHEL